MLRLLNLLALAAVIFFGPGEVGAQEPLVPTDHHAISGNGSPAAHLLEDAGR